MAKKIIKLPSFVVVASSALLVACIGAVQQSKQANFDGAWRTAQLPLAQSFAQQYAEIDRNGNTGDLVWALQLGITERALGNFATSNSVLDSAERQVNFEDNESAIARAGELAGSMLVNDAALDYEPYYYDGVMLNTYKAWNFWQLGDLQNARVELNRAEERQRLAVRYFEQDIVAQREAAFDGAEDQSSLTSSYQGAVKQIRRQQGDVLNSEYQAYDGYVNPFTTYSMGLFRMLNPSGSSDYSSARQAFDRVASVTQNETFLEDADLVDRLREGRESLNGHTWVILERGQSVIKREFRIGIPIYLYGAFNDYYTMALPYLRPRPSLLSVASVNEQRAVEVADMNRIIETEFSSQYWRILVREITRATAKMLITREVARKDDDGLATFAAILAQAATTSADTRIVSSLPERFEVIRARREDDFIHLDLGSNSHKIKVDRSARAHVIYVREISGQTEPIISTINIQ